MNQKNNNHKTGYIVIGAICGFFMLLLLIGCIIITVKICQYAEEGKIDAWLEEEDDSDWYEDDYDEDDSDWYDDEDDSDWHDEYDEDDDDWLDDYDESDSEWNDDDYDWDEPIVTYEDMMEGPSNGKYFAYETDNRVYDLSYQVEMISDEYFDEGQSGDDYYTTYVQYFYPVVSGDVPNVDIINETIAAEWQSFIEYYEEDYRPYITGDEDSIYAELIGRVAYMSEDVLSIVYQEDIMYGDEYYDAYVYSLNFDMKSGVLLDNTQILNTDEEFAKTFVIKNNVQNGEFSDLEELSYEEIAEMMDTNRLILFYVPQGMEVGLNTENGWVSITLEDYEKYLKVL